MEHSVRIDKTVLEVLVRRLALGCGVYLKGADVDAMPGHLFEDSQNWVEGDQGIPSLPLVSAEGSSVVEDTIDSPEKMPKTE
jgi:hypothetical protein